MKQLTQNELQTLANILAQVNVPVSQAPPLIDLINKMSQMIDQLRSAADKVASLSEDDQEA